MSIGIESREKLKESFLAPRFYTTDFYSFSRFGSTKAKEEFAAIVEELRQDYNNNSFVREVEFSKTKQIITNKFDTVFNEFLVRSCVAEFSGFLLYKELSLKLKKLNPIAAEGFSFMARDEARHAGFLAKASRDFNATADLSFLNKKRSYTFFAPLFILYSAYLSEKIGYWRYITIYRHLEKNPNSRINPLFKFFENWCQDENRHGDFFATLLKSQGKLLSDKKSKLWCRFFLLSVFITMYLKDLEQSAFYLSIGLDPIQFAQHVIKKTSQNTENLFPVTLNIHNPNFFFLLNKCVTLNQKLYEINKKITFKTLKFILKTPHYINLLIIFIKLYFLKPIHNKIS